MHKFGVRGLATACVIGCVALLGGTGGGLADASQHARSTVPSRTTTPPPPSAGWHVSMAYPGMTLFAIACPSTSGCIAVGSTPADNHAAGSYDSPAAIVATTDGGATWTSERPPPETYDLRSIACSSTSDCTAVGGTDGLGAIVATTDRGATWTSEENPSLRQYGFSAVACPSTSDCTAVGSGFASSLAIVATTDGGGTWTRERPPSGSLYQLGAIACPSTSDCTAVSYSTPVAIITTTDGGATWTRERIPPPGTSGNSGAYGWSAIACPSTSDCTVVGSDSTGSAMIITTTDGGATWTRERPPSEEYELQGVACPSTSRCTAVGDYSGIGTGYAITTTIDGGATWTGELLPSKSLYNLQGVACFSSSHCTAVGGGFVQSGPGALILTDTSSARQIRTTLPPSPLCVMSGAGMQLELRKAICHLSTEVAMEVRSDTEDTSLLYAFATSELSDAFYASWATLGLDVVHAGLSLASNSAAIQKLPAALDGSNPAAEAAGLRALAAAHSTIKSLGTQVKGLALWPAATNGLLSQAKKVYAKYDGPGGLGQLFHSLSDHPSEKTTNAIYKALWRGDLGWVGAPATSPIEIFGSPLPPGSSIADGHPYTVAMIQLLQECQAALAAASRAVPAHFVDPATPSRLLAELHAIKSEVESAANGTSSSMLSGLPGLNAQPNGLVAADFSQANGILSEDEKGLQVAQHSVVLTGVTDEAQVLIAALGDGSANTAATDSTSATTAEEDLSSNSKDVTLLARAVKGAKSYGPQIARVGLKGLAEVLHHVSAQVHVNIVSAPQAMANLAVKATEDLSLDGTSLWQMADAVDAVVSSMSG